jgi:phosphoribosylamine--glycine ligase
VSGNASALLDGPIEVVHAGIDAVAEAPRATGAAVTVVVAAGSYPERGDTGTPIDGVADAESTGALVFHAGTARAGGSLVTNGGRILGVTGVGTTVADARALAYEAVERISFDGARYRRDVAGG